MAKKKKGVLAIAVIAAITVVAGIVVLAWLAGSRAPSKNVKEINAYFTSEDGFYLTPEKRSIEKGPLEKELSEAVEALLAGPKNDKLANPFPDGTKLLGIKINGKTALVNFSEELIKNHPGGSSWEIETVYSAVNTIALNFPEVQDVQILVEGKKAETIAGHIDITQPLGPDKKIIKQ